MVDTLQYSNIPKYVSKGDGCQRWPISTNVLFD